MKIWDERNRREKEGSSVDQLAVGKSVEEQTLFMEAVLIVIKHLVGNGLPPGGLFLRNIDKHCFSAETRHCKSFKTPSRECQCTSSDVQNEVITILTACVKNKIAQEVRDGEICTVSADGTSDSDGNECFAIVLRYACKDDLQVKAHVIHIVEAKDRTAKGLMEIISKTLSEMGLSLDSVAAQCYYFVRRVGVISYMSTAIVIVFT